MSDSAPWIGRRAWHSAWDCAGVILDVHLDRTPPTAKFLPEDWEEHKATWVNLGSLKLLPEKPPVDDEFKV